MAIGRGLSKVASPLRWLKLNWLVLVGLGSIALIINLFWQKSLTLRDTLLVIMPILHNASPILTCLLIAPLLVTWLGRQSNEVKNRLREGLLVAFFASFVFSENLWGFAETTTITPYLALIVLGAITPYVKKWKKGELLLSLILLGIGIALMMIMPIASMDVHGDWSTANRYSNYSNWALIVGAWMLFKHVSFTNNFLQRTQEMVIPIGATFTLPTLSGWLVKWTNYFQGGLIKRLMITIIITLVGMLVATLLRKLVPPFSRLAMVQSFLRMELPTTFNALQRFWKRYWSVLIPWGVCLVVAFISFVGVETSWQIPVQIQDMGGKTGQNIFTFILFGRPSMVIINAVFLWVLYRALLGLTNRYWVSLGLVTALEVVWTIANRIKIDSRQEPIMPGEVTMVQAYGEILKMVSPYILISALIGIVGFTVLIYWTEKRNPIIVQQGILKRICYVSLAIVLFGSANWWNHSGNVVSKALEGFGNQPTFENQLYGVRINGPLIQFMNNIDDQAMFKPTGYSRAEMEKLAQRYKKAAQQINKNRSNRFGEQTVIFNLSESYADPRRVPGIEISPSPTPYIDQLKKRTTSGLMLSSGYGGGTANMEYMTLTGLAMANFMPTLSTPYTQLVPFTKHAWSINQLFATSVALHPFTGAFYNRPIVYKKFGFDRFMYLGSQFKIKHQLKYGTSTYLSDETTYQNAYDVLKKDHSSLFMNLISIQNHLPYDKGFYTLDDSFKVRAANATNLDLLKDYTAGIHYTDQAVKKFIRQLDKLKQPVTLVFYGDHLPGIYANSFAEDGLKLHETDYFIYSNKAARAKGARNLTNSSRIVAPNDFIAMVAEQTNSKVTPYIAFLTAMYHEMPVESVDTQGTVTKDSSQTKPQFTTKQGKIISQKQFTKRQQQLFHDYQLIQYDLTAGKQYLFKFWQMKWNC